MQHAAASKNSGSGVANHDFFIGPWSQRFGFRDVKGPWLSMAVSLLVPVKACFQTLPCSVNG